MAGADERPSDNDEGASPNHPSPLEDALAHRFSNPTLLVHALRHPSDAKQAVDSNQRLEFLGDRVLGLVIATMLYQAFPDEEEGSLAQRFSALVRRDALERVARDISLGDHLALGRGEGAGGGRDNPANLADACEAVIGALYLDGGLAAAERFIHTRWTPAMNAHQVPPRDSKTLLQEWAQGHGAALPVYRTLTTSGPPHAPIFEVEAEVARLGRATATGSTKRAAEQAAASILMDRAERDG